MTVENQPLKMQKILTETDDMINKIADEIKGAEAPTRPSSSAATTLSKP